MADASSFAKRVIANVERAIVGKRPQLILSLVAWLCEGHILLEDVPGVAKTMLARALARSVGCAFKRIQCTPDLLPSDVTGASIFNQKSTEFEFRPGPIFAQVVLADEVNRATPRTQAALLEAMGEGRVTVDGLTYKLGPPFLLIATQNPVDHEGTFPLPEAQLDRFLMRFSLGYPTQEEELKMLEMLQHSHPIDALEPVANAEEVTACQQAVREIYVDDKVRRYLLQIVHDTRAHDDIGLGASPRASIALFRTSQAMAALRGRNYVLPDDVKRVAGPVLTHRVILRPKAACARSPPARSSTRSSPRSPYRRWRSGRHHKHFLMIWFAGSILLLVIALVFNLPLLAYAMYVLLAVLLVSRFLTRRWAESLAATRECNQLSAEIGQSVAVMIAVKNQAAWPVAWVLLEDLLPRDALMYVPPRLQVSGRRVSLMMLNGHAKKNLLYQLTPTRRGYYQLGPLVLETGDLFGLHRRYRVATDPHFLLVLPKVIPLAGYEVSSKRPIGEVRMSYRLYEDPTRISGVRAYERGDSLNRIHWRATARTGVLHSKVYEPSTVAGATLLVEFHLAAHDRARRAAPQRAGDHRCRVDRQRRLSDEPASRPRDQRPRRRRSHSPRRLGPRLPLARSGLGVRRRRKARATGWPRSLCRRAAGRNNSRGFSNRSPAWN